MDFLKRLYAYIPSWTYSQSSDGSSASSPESSLGSNQDPTSNTSPKGLQVSDFRSSVHHEYRTIELYLFNPLDYTDENERQRRLDFFLKNIVPSKVTRSEGVERLRVFSPSYVEDQALGDEESLRDDWRKLQSTPEQINFRTISELALTHRCLRGFWMLIYKPCDTDKHDEEWVKVARATVDGELGMFVKVAIRFEPDSDGNIFINVYTKNFTNKRAVMDLEGRIRRLGVRGQMVFKPSFYTVLRINANNQWSLKTGIYMSQWDPVRNESVVQDKTK